MAGSPAVVMRMLEAVRNKMDAVDNKMEAVDNKMEAVDNGVQKLLLPMSALVDTALDDFKHDSNSRGSASSEGGFRNRLRLDFGEFDAATGRLKCMVTNLFLPENLVVAGHILSKQNSGRARRWLGITDVNAASNGILWCNALEEAWGKNQFCFIFNPGAFHELVSRFICCMCKVCDFLLCYVVSTDRPGVLRVHILDSSILDQPLVSAMGCKQSLVDAEAVGILGGLTFGQLATQSDLYGLPLGRISKTSLAFMSGLHIRWAKDANWVFSSVEDHLLSYSSDGDKRALVEGWVAQSRLARRLGSASEYVADDPAGTSSDDNSERQLGTSVEGVDALAQVDATEGTKSGVPERSAEGGALAAEGTPGRVPFS